MANKVKLFTRSDIQHLFTMAEAVPVIEKAFSDYARSANRMPAKIYLDLPEHQGDFRAMPAYLPARSLAGIKWVNSHAQNPGHGLPAVMAMMIVNQAATGLPVAILDATLLTSIRTGAAGAVAARYLAPPELAEVAFVGTGTQAFFQLQGLLQVRSPLSLRIYDPNQQSRTLFRQAAAALFSNKIIECKSIEECVDNADLIVTTTPSRAPLVMKEWVKKGAHINAIGADAPGKQELDIALLKSAKIVVDDPGQAAHSGEINVAIAQQKLSESDICASIGQVVNGHVCRESEADITVFDSTGLAIQDLASAAYILEKASHMGAGFEFEF